MPTVSGYTTFGIIRKRMADLYADFALRIKESGVFGTQTTADLPDSFPTDPLVQIMSTTSASLHEVWEAVELWYTQLDPRTASGTYLEYMHGLRLGIARGVGQSDADYRIAILAALARPTRTDIATVAAARPDIDCAVLLTSTVDNPLPNVPTPGNVLVVKACAGVVDYHALACDIYASVELGVHEFYGEQIGSCVTPTGGCVLYKFSEAQPLFAAVQVTGYYTAACAGTAQVDVTASVLAKLNAAYASCAIGADVNTAVMFPVLGTIEGFVVTDIKLARRPRQLWFNDCDPATAPKVTICAKEVPWVTSITCGLTAGEVWCAPAVPCLILNPWEYIAFDAQFITVINDATKGGCA